MAIGEVVEGNIGSSQLLDYTYIGNTVNIASRLEACTRLATYFTMLSSRQYKVPMLITKEIVNKTRKPVSFIGHVKLKNIKEEVPCYTLQAMNNDTAFASATDLIKQWKIDHPV